MKSRWYKDAVFYQIYPRSFCDSNGDGIGDIKGITSKLDYLSGLGINAVWLSPIYKSPNDDNGYDVSDYRNIMDEFGTMEDWTEMIDAMHKRGIKLVMDLVVNHSSDEHFWFKESKKSKDSPYRNYYIWRKGKGKDGKKPPNNWTSRFTGSAWTYDETTAEWYLHLFSKKQPDLNWDNPKVRKEIIDICNYWFEKGVDGFRCDVITYISKNNGLPNGKFNPIMCGDEHFVLGEHIHEYLNEINLNSWSKYDTMIVGEAIGVHCSEVEPLIKESNNELDSAITFESMEVDMMMNFLPRKFNLPKFKAVANMWQTMPNDCWNTLYYENHDQPRSVTRYCKGDVAVYRDKMAKMLAICLHCQKGTPYVYQGQEIGMTNIDLREDEYVDILATKVFTLIKKLFPPFMPIARWAMARRARDHARTPMQWTADKNCGFTTGTPWMKVNPNCKDINVENDLKNPDSILNFYKEIISFRKYNEIIRDGAFEMIYPKNKSLFAYKRKLNGKGYVVICNFKDSDINFELPQNLKISTSKLVISNYTNSFPTLASFAVKPYEAVVYEITY